MNIKGTFLGYVMGSILMALIFLITLDIFLPVFYWGKTLNASFNAVFEPVVLLKNGVLGIAVGIFCAIIKMLQERGVIRRR